MSARVVLRQQLEEAARVLHHERRQRRRASRRERAQHQRCLVRSKERSKLLATVALYCEQDATIMSLVAVLLAACTAEEAVASAWVSREPSALQISRRVEVVREACISIKKVPLPHLATVAQRLCAEARVAIWVRRMNMKGVAPLAEQLSNQLSASWPESDMLVIDNTFHKRILGSTVARKKWAWEFKARWAMQWKAMPKRPFLEIGERSKRVLQLL